MLRIGRMTIGSIEEWEPSLGSVISWQPTPAAREKARQAPVSSVPVSYMQAQHLRGYHEQTAMGLDYSRLLIFTCDMPGHCDIRAMNYVLNAHLRRHDTYRSWFEFTDAGDIIRHTIGDPADIEFVPVRRGKISLQDLHKQIVDTPNPLQWDCFTIGIIQSENHFTFYASIDHVHVDATLVGVTLMEFYLMYTALAVGDAPLALPPAGSYDDYCVRQRQYTSALTLDSPQVRSWIDFAEKNNGSFPDFPLPLGDPSEPTGSGIVTEMLMDAEQTVRFESACVEAGARFIGGVFACTALAEHELTGAVSYCGLTPSDTRRTPADLVTQGWFTGLVPITIPIAAASFGDAARSAQISFDSGLDLANVPYQRVLELAPWLSGPRPNFPVLNFLDAGAAPLSALLTAELDDAKNISLYGDGRYSYQLSIYVFRDEKGTAMAVMFPDNPIARKSVASYITAMRSVCARVADRGHWQRVA
ncbi:MAG: acyltransferase [Mycobacteriaceae bacterium]|nr:acyltransferase [Mycobacteriaceae bacterium]